MLQQRRRQRGIDREPGGRLCSERGASLRAGPSAGSHLRRVIASTGQLRTALEVGPTGLACVTVMRDTGMQRRESAGV